nr:DegT/DnrJ/EryC1/StrS family aminotransferase [uncultured Dethiosulfovibrio sp.]
MDEIKSPKIATVLLSYDYGLPERRPSLERGRFFPAICDFADVTPFWLEENGYPEDLEGLQDRLGRVQLKKLPDFIRRRKENWSYLRDRLGRSGDRLILPEAQENGDPSWFGFLITVREEARFTRDDGVRLLEGKGVQTRMLFAGNLIKHPCFDSMRSSGVGYRRIGDLSVTDRIMRDTFWIGVYPAWTPPP